MLGAEPPYPPRCLLLAIQLCWLALHELGLWALRSLVRFRLVLLVLHLLNTWGGRLVASGVREFLIFWWAVG